MKITLDKAGELLEAMGYELEQAEQEPVAWILTDADGTMDFDCQPTIKPTQNDYDALREGETFTPLYAAPVRTKDLTDDEIYKANQTEIADSQYLVEFARAVIAKDREKNK